MAEEFDQEQGRVDPTTGLWVPGDAPKPARSVRGPISPYRAHAQVMPVPPMISTPSEDKLATKRRKRKAQRKARQAQRK